LRDKIKNNSNLYLDFFIENNIVKKKIIDLNKGTYNVLVIPEQLRELILDRHHNSALSAHIGREKMYKLIQTKYYWPGMYNDVRLWVNSCIKCATHKRIQNKDHGQLQPISSSYPFEIVSIDILGPFTKSTNGNKFILVLVDYFTNWVEACAVKTIEAPEIADAIFKLIICRHGCPSKFLTNKGTQFTSNLFKYLCIKMGIQKLETTALHPQTNGKVEKFNHFIVNALATLSNKEQTNWDEMIDPCLFAYRSTISRIIDETPFFLIYGRDPVLPNDLLFGNIKPPQAENLLDYKIDLVQRLKRAYEKINKSRTQNVNKYRDYYDQKHKKQIYNIGDNVMLYWPVPVKGLTQKLLPKWDGPYVVTNRLGEVTYRIEKDNGKTHTVHVQRLRLYSPWKINSNFL
jgi:hypothetical protein